MLKMVENNLLEEYTSDIDIDNKDNFTQTATNNKRSKQNRKKWLPISTFPSKDEAIALIKSEEKWSIINTNTTSEGKRVYYRCNQVKRRGIQCPSMVHLLYHSEMKPFQCLQPLMNISMTKRGIVE